MLLCVIVICDFAMQEYESDYECEHGCGFANLSEMVVAKHEKKCKKAPRKAKALPAETPEVLGELWVWLIEYF